MSHNSGLCKLGLQLERKSRTMNLFTISVEFLLSYAIPTTYLTIHTDTVICKTNLALSISRYHWESYGKWLTHQSWPQKRVLFAIIQGSGRKRRTWTSKATGTKYSNEARCCVQCPPLGTVWPQEAEQATCRLCYWVGWTDFSVWREDSEGHRVEVICLGYLPRVWVITPALIRW